MDTDTETPSPHTTRRPRSKAAAFVIALAGAMLFATFISLGTWQIERRAWKHALVERVEQRVHAAPVAAPGPADWPKVNADDDEYRRVAITGHFLHDKETLVQAVTNLGSGFWVLTPLQTTDGTTVLVNRGFVPPERRDRSTRQASEPTGDDVNVVGLVRMTEPYGAFLRSNDAATDRWFSRDVAAIASARGLTKVAPYFIDATAVANAPETEPVGGLTVISFPDNHLVYALTWYALALMVVAGAWRFVRYDRGR